MAKPHRRLLGFAVLLHLGVVLGLALAGSGCSSRSPSRTESSGSPARSGGTSGGSGGSTSLGGATGSGGTMASGGTTSSGGVSASGGATGSGGAAGGGGGVGTTVSAGRGGGAGRNGGGGVGGSIDGGGSMIPSTITLTSPVLMEGGTFPANITCADPGMGSPELDWTAGPSGTMSYAVTLTDLTEGRIDWALWNIPVPSGTPTTITLPAHLDTLSMLTTPMGANQTNSHQAKGYSGPCLGDGTTHTYRFQVYAIPTASLAGTTFDTSTDMATANMRAIATATGTLTAMSNAHH